MKLKCKYITDEINTFIPNSLFDVNPLEKLWLEVNYGDLPPVELRGLLEYSPYPGLLGRYICIEVYSHNINLKENDILSLNKQYSMVIHELEQDELK